jgi:phosphoserine phosphatase RsbU/P
VSAPPSVLLVAGGGGDGGGGDGSAAELVDALLALSYRVRQVATVEEALAQLPGDPADLLLAPAEAMAARLGETSTRPAPPAGVPPGDASATAWGTTATGSATGLLVYAHEAQGLRGSIAAGLRDFLLPPFEPDLVRIRVEAVLERVQSREERADEAKREELLKLERDLQIGRTIQQGFLPATLPQPKGWEITACFQPAREVAGDFYDAFYMINKRRVGFVIADVCDKGVGAALFMSLFRTLVRSNAQHNTSLGWMDPSSGSITEDKDWLKGDPAQRRQSLPTIGTGALMNAVAGTNDYITENHMEQGYFATMFFGVLDPNSGALVYINGGHNPPVLHRSDGRQELLKPTGPAVGMLPGVKFKMGQARLDPGDVLYAYTDGVTDARSPSGAFFTERRLFDIVAAGAPSAQALVDDVERQVTAHIAHAPQFDDITMLAIRRVPLPDDADA